MFVRGLARLALLVAASSSIVACAASAVDDAASETASEHADGLSAPPIEACPSPRTYLVLTFEPSGAPLACPSIDGRHGTWAYSGPDTIRACIAHDPSASGTPVLCAYDWQPSARYPDAPPDVGALDAIPGALVAPASTGGATCNDGSLLPYGTLLHEADVTCPLGGGGPDGPHECDVCSLPLFPGVFEGSMWIPISAPVRSVVVAISNGSKQVITIGATTRHAAPTASSSPYVRVALPPLPRGTHWVRGPVLGYGYDTP